MIFVKFMARIKNYENSIHINKNINLRQLYFDLYVIL